MSRDNDIPDGQLGLPWRFRWTLAFVWLLRLLAVTRGCTPIW